jgi:glycosyltransferase involved in cell wall biosynthesis
MSGRHKIAIIGTVGIPAKHGGFETLAEQLVKQLGDQYDMTVYCSKKKYSRKERVKSFSNAKLKYLPFRADGAQSILYDSLAIWKALFYADVLLILGVAGAWMLPFIKFFTNKKVIISIDGIQWKKDNLNPIARWYLKWAEKIAIKYSNADISDNESVQDYTAMRYGTLSNIIEYGASHTSSVKPGAADKEIYPFLAKPYAFNVCRIEPENNIHMILEAFSAMEKYILVIVGNWNNSHYGAALRKQYGSFENIIMMDPVYDQHQLDLIRSNAYLYIHGHSAGGTNPSLVEAMYLGLPIITFDVSFNRTTTENKAFYFNSAATLIKIIENTRIVELKEQSLLMKEVAYRRYTWAVITEKYNYLFHRVIKSHKKISVRPATKFLGEKKLAEYGLQHLQSNSLFYEKR